MKAGYYHFGAALSPDEKDGRLAITIVHNSRNGVYARYENTLKKLSDLSKRQFFKLILSTKDYLSAHVVTIIKLELYDMVDV